MVRWQSTRNPRVEAVWKPEGPTRVLLCTSRAALRRFACRNRVGSHRFDGLDQRIDFRVGEEALGTAGSDTRERRFVQPGRLHGAIRGEVLDHEANEVELRGAQGLALDESRQRRGRGLAIEANE